MNPTWTGSSLVRPHPLDGRDLPAVVCVAPPASALLLGLDPSQRHLGIEGAASSLSTSIRLSGIRNAKAAVRVDLEQERVAERLPGSLCVAARVVGLGGPEPAQSAYRDSLGVFRHGAHVAAARATANGLREDAVTGDQRVRSADTSVSAGLPRRHPPSSCIRVNAYSSGSGRPRRCQSASISSAGGRSCSATKRSIAIRAMWRTSNRSRHVGSGGRSFKVSATKTRQSRPRCRRLTRLSPLSPSQPSSRATAFCWTAGFWVRAKTVRIAALTSSSLAARSCSTPT